MKTITQNLQKLKSSLESKPQINIVVVTKTRSPEEIQEAIAAGATSVSYTHLTLPTIFAV